MIQLGLDGYRPPTKMPGGAQGIVSGILPSAQGDAPVMGTQDMLEGFDSMPWLRAVADKVGLGVSGLDWQLLGVRGPSGKFVKSAAIERAASGRREKLLGPLLEAGSAEVILDHPYVEALERPNPFMTRVGLLKITEIHYDLVGDAFWLKERNGLGKPCGFWPIPPHWVMDTPTPSDPTYRFGYRSWQVVVPESEVHRFHEAAPVHPYARGSGIGWTLGDELEVDEYAAKMARQLFWNRARPDFVVYGFTDAKEAKRLEYDWNARNQGFWRQDKPYFVMGEPKFHEFTKTQLDQLVYPGLRKSQRDIVLQVWGTSPELFGIVENSNRATIDAAEYLFAKWVITPKAERLRRDLQRLAQEEYDERAIVHFVSPIEEDKADQLSVMKAAPWAFTEDEWRRRAGARPLNSTVRMVPLASYATTDLLDQMQRPKGPAPTTPPPAEDDESKKDDKKGAAA
jgi:hypothetical protein